MVALAIAFFVTALLYAGVGFGGGSTYNALLALAGVDYRILPVVALACNIVVVAGATIRFARERITPWKRAALLVALAAPAAFAGGMVPIGEAAFLLTLGGSLLFAGAALLVSVSAERLAGPPARAALLVPVAAPALGFLAGLTGIGGGIFLAPLLHLVRWAEPRAVAATASLFILVNSLSGLAGQLLKGGPDRLGAAAAFGLPLLLAVAIGGQIGSLLAARHLPAAWLRYGTAILVLAVGIRLSWGVLAAG
jgi:uncharacterized membrane protein YfcA